MVASVRSAPVHQRARTVCVGLVSVSCGGGSAAADRDTERYGEGNYEHMKPFFSPTAARPMYSMALCLHVLA